MMEIYQGIKFEVVRVPDESVAPHEPRAVALQRDRDRRAVRSDHRSAQGGCMVTPDPTVCDHDWEFQDDSFDHDFGTERVHYWRCALCDATREVEPGDFDYEDD